MGVIYKATNLVNELSYIGQAKNFKVRQSQHLKAKDNYDFHVALRDFGKDNFKWEILEECEENLLNERERYWIAYYDTYNNGYNMTKGGENADGLVNWIKNNPDKAKENALNGLKYANQYHAQHKEEHLKQLASVRQKGVDATKKKVRCIEKDIVFDSLADAEKWSLTEENDNHKKASHQHISKVCKGQRKTCGGYHWEYV